MGERINISTEVNCHLKKNEIDKIKYKLYIQNKDVKTIMFTSTKKGEGKSTIMLALANSIASDQKNSWLWLGRQDGIMQLMITIFCCPCLPWHILETLLFELLFLTFKFHFQNPRYKLVL